MAIEFLDTFTEISDTELSLHTPDIGAGWSRLIAVGADPLLRIVGFLDQLAQFQGADGDGVLYQADDVPSARNYEVSVKMVKGDTGDNPSGKDAEPKDNI